MLDEKSIWRVGDFLTRGAEERGVLHLYREDPLERDDEGYWGLTIKAHSVMRMDRTRLPYLP